MRPPTDSQWEAIRTTDRHLLVAAGAGTGKTHTVVGKILYLLGVPLRDAVHPTPLALRDIAAITFTNQAAADLKDKLRTALRESGRVAESYEVDNARIGTIHGFCGDLLREFALRSGRSPGGGVLDEGEGAALADEAVTDAILAALEEGGSRLSALGSRRALPAAESQPADFQHRLGDLFATWSVAEVHEWVAELAAESDRLEHLALGYGELGPQERTLVDLARRAVALSAERLEARQAMDFDRMITWTRDLVRDHPSVRRALQRRIRVLIVDEFQDVDPVQKEIAYLLGEPDSGRADTTRLMLVGDPKQSIYRFRRADVTVWRHVQRDFERGHGNTVTLADNFRSVAPVLAIVANTVGRILDRPLDGEQLQAYEVPFTPVRATRTDGPADHAVELLLVPPKDDGNTRSSDDVRAIEAEAVARRMKELHAGGVAWQEMAVLLAGWGAADVYAGALERWGIPTYTLRNTGFYDRPEIVDLIVALEAVRDPRDDRALVGFMRGPMVGLRDETLLGVARGCGRPYWDHLRSCSVAERALLDRGIALLGRYAAMRDRVPTVDLLRGLLEESGYLAHLALMGRDGDRPLANVRQFLRMAAAAPETSVGELLRTVRETRDRKDRVGEARLHGESDPVVTITTVHSAKGLEWKVVFWCDLVRGRRVDHPKLLVGRERLELGKPELKGEEQSPAWQALRAEIEHEELAEQKRLWYVAATRAADRLILSGIPQGTFRGPSGKGCPAAEIKLLLPEIEVAGLEAIAYAGVDGRTFQAVVRYADPEEAYAAGAAAEGPVLSATSLELPAVRLPALLGRGRHSATEFLAFARCQRRHWFKYVAGLREPAVDRTGPDFGNAIARDLIVHDVLEHLREEADVDRLLEEAIGRHDEDAPEADAIDGRSYREELRREVERVASSPDYRSIADLPTARRELGFLHVAGQGAVIEGKIDLAAADGAGVVLLDVKTNQGDEAAVRRKAAHYGPQRDVYVSAVEAVGGQEVSRFAFQFSGAGVQVGETVSAELRADARARVNDVAARIGAGERALTLYPAECGFCGYRRVGWCPGAGPPA